MVYDFLHQKGGVSASPGKAWEKPERSAFVCGMAGEIITGEKA